MNSNLKKKVYEIVSKIPKGKVTTYKLIAEKTGTKSYRLIGRILNQNKNHDKIPCHRVVMSNSHIGGYNLGISKKQELLKKENITIKNNKIQNLEKYLFKP